MLHVVVKLPGDTWYMGNAVHVEVMQILDQDRTWTDCWQRNRWHVGNDTFL